jgi:hypothetical protein
VSGEPETPWALLKRLRAEGHANGVIVTRLKALGLEDEDVRVLMLEAPPAASGLEMPDAVKAAAVLAGGPLLGGLLIASMQDATLPREAPAPQVELDDTDTSARCALHPKLASVGTCPRCGTFVCRECAGPQLVTGCLKCQATPALRDDRVKAAARNVAVSGLVIAGLLATVMLMVITNLTLRELIGLGVMTLPPSVFWVLQLVVRAPWPGIVGVVLSLATAGLFLFGAGMSLISVFWFAGIAIQVTLISRLVTVRKSLQ